MIPEGPIETPEDLERELGRMGITPPRPLTQDDVDEIKRMSDHLSDFISTNTMESKPLTREDVERAIELGP